MRLRVCAGLSAAPVGVSTMRRRSAPMSLWMRLRVCCGVISCAGRCVGHALPIGAEDRLWMRLRVWCRVVCRVGGCAVNTFAGKSEESSICTAARLASFSSSPQSHDFTIMAAQTEHPHLSQWFRFGVRSCVQVWV